MIEKLESTAKTLAWPCGFFSIASEPGAGIVRRLFTGPEIISNSIYNGIQAFVDIAESRVNDIGGNLLEVAQDLAREVSTAAHYMDKNINYDSEATLAVALGTVVGMRYILPLARKSGIIR